MGNRMNYDRLRHAGRPTEQAFERKPDSWHPNQAAKAASPARGVSDERRLELQVQFDEQQRDELSKKRELITLVREPEFRDTPSGRVVVFRGLQEGRDKAIVAVMRASPAEKVDEGTRDELNDRVRKLGGGDRVSLAGGWIKRRWEKDGVPKEHWEFSTQRFQPGDVPLEHMKGIPVGRVAAAASMAQSQGR